MPTCALFTRHDEQPRAPTSGLDDLLRRIDSGPLAPSRMASIAASSKPPPARTTPACPWDWSLKSGVLVTSSRDLSWCTALPTEAEGRGLVQIAASADALDEDDDFVAFARACVHWAFAADVDAGGDGFAASYGVWVEALRSAYFQLRHGQVAYFYTYLRSWGWILWRNADVAAAAHLASVDAATGVYAVVAQSSPSLIASLRTNDVPFRPGAGPGPPAARDESPALDLDMEADLRSLNADAGRGDGASRHGVPSEGAGVAAGPLLCRGHDGVHGLFDVLTSSTAPEQLAGARILAQGPFLHGTCARLRAVRNGPLLQKAGPGETQSVHALELAGLVLPGSLHALCRVLDRHQEGAFRLRAPALDRTQAINRTCPDGAVTCAQIVRADGCWEVK